MGEEIEEIEVKSKRPKNSKFFQQRLWAWQPILTVGNICPYFYIVSVLFIPLGAFFLVTSNQVHEVSLPYTFCDESGVGGKCAEKVKDPNFFGTYSTCPCQLNFTLDSDMKGPVYAFYGLTNFYQNHRRYVLSRDDDQLNGQDIKEPSENCAPYRYGITANVRTAYAPCGAIAMSLFNDTFSVTLQKKKGGTSSLNETVQFNFSNIAWQSDVNDKFGKPKSWNNTMKPFSWPKSAYQFNQNAYSGFQQLVVWMRIAALPNFRKNYGSVEAIGSFADGLPAGDYVLDVKYAYPVTQFGGTKRFILSNASWLGGRNPTLGIAYIVVGCIHLVFALIFTLIHFKLRKKQRNRIIS